MKRSVAWDSLFMCKEGQLMHLWGKVNLVQVERTQKGKGRIYVEPILAIEDPQPTQKFWDQGFVVVWVHFGLNSY